MAVTIYTTPTCPYCIRAKALLKNKGIDFTEHTIHDLSDEERQALSAKTGGYRTVPQIFINEQFIGGSDDLHALEQQGELDKLL